MPGTGLTFDDESYKEIPLTAPLTRGSFDNLPKQVSLQAYAPTPGNQGQTGTCVAWSSAYHARTIAESIRLNRTDRMETDKEVFSPSYVYNQIRNAPGCDNGTYIHHAMEVMKLYGVPKFSMLRFECLHEINQSDHQHAQPFRIAGYKALFEPEGNNKILPVKKSLAEKKPVVIGMLCPESFFTARDVWIPAQTEYNQSAGGHAMVAIGYDDNKNGGSFLVMNSWGTQWGTQGFIWIRYEDFNHFVKYGFELIEEPEESHSLAGSLQLILADGNQMQTSFSNDRGFYLLNETYVSGTRFRLLLSNHQAAYVYAFGSDLTKKNSKLFPHQEGISPYLGYSGNEVALPSERHYIRLDDKKGTDYLCVLYSREPLELNSILQKMEYAPGTFKERLTKVLGNQLISVENSGFAENTMKFSAKSNKKSSIVALVVEIDHQ